MEHSIEHDGCTVPGHVELHMDTFGQTATL